MKSLIKYSYFLLLISAVLFLSRSIYAQDIQVITHELTKYEPVGTLEIVVEFEVINISNQEQTVFEVRTIDNVPAGWSSSLCFGELCFASHIDSVATTPDFLTPSLQPSDTLKTSLHVFTDQASIGSASVQIEVGTSNYPDDRIVLDFTVTTDPTLDVNEDLILNSYQLEQNYPNPFNPTTKISWQSPVGSWQTIKVYDVLGSEVVTLIDEFREAGSYEVNFDASSLTSGVYFYTLRAGNPSAGSPKGQAGQGYVETKKMLLMK